MSLGFRQPASGARAGDAARISRLMRALEGDLAQMSVDEFYRLSRALLVKDKRHPDNFDVVFPAT